MISFESNISSALKITNDQLNAVVDLITEAGWDLSYDVVGGDTDGIIWLWEFRHDQESNPTRHWIEIDGTIRLQEEVTWDWKGIQHDH